MAVRECRRGLGARRCAGVGGIRNAWVRGSIPRGGSTLQPSNSGIRSAQAVKLPADLGPFCEVHGLKVCPSEIVRRGAMGCGSLLPTLSTSRGRRLVRSMALRSRAVAAPALARQSSWGRSPRRVVRDAHRLGTRRMQPGQQPARHIRSARLSASRLGPLGRRGMEHSGAAADQGRPEARQTERGRRRPKRESQDSSMTSRRAHTLRAVDRGGLAGTQARVRNAQMNMYVSTPTTGTDSRALRPARTRCIPRRDRGYTVPAAALS